MCVCGAPLNDRANGSYVDVLFTCGECGFYSLGSWFYFKEWVLNLGTKFMMHWNLVLDIDCYRIVICITYLWPND